jgi:O-antigen ligase/polysaccharide polymerase Wzy-like membrane protein
MKTLRAQPPLSRLKQHAPTESGLEPSDVTRLLTVYLLLLVAVPSGVRIAALGSLGQPSLLWGLLLFAWWTLWRITALQSDLNDRRSPVRVAFFAFLVVGLVSFGAALLRGQPDDQVSPASTALLRILSWGGSVLVGLDGLQRLNDLMIIVRRVALAGTLLAAFGLLQFITRQSLLDWWPSIPGIEMVEGGVVTRGAFTRASGTAIHPLEHATALAASLPLTIALAMLRTTDRSRRSVPLGQTPQDDYLRHLRIADWVPAGIIALGSILAVSRSALIGLVIASVASLPILPKRLRIWAISAGLGLAATALFSVRGLLTTLLGLFSPSGDASTQSRTDALARLPDFVSQSPIYGVGFGTFLPRYYIFDNAWALMAVELGIAGVLAFLGLFVTSILCALEVARHSTGIDAQIIGKGLGAASLTIGVVFAFFDGLAFPIAAGYAFLLFGLCGAMWSMDPVQRDSPFESGSVLER